MSVKIGRNDPCWCDSGKKFKHCHGPVEEGRRIDKGDFAKIVGDRLANPSHFCMHPHAGSACSEKIIRAHSVQRGGGLSRIARRGEVYYFKESFSVLAKSPGKILPTLVGY